MRTNHLPLLINGALGDNDNAALSAATTSELRDELRQSITRVQTIVAHLSLTAEVLDNGDAGCYLVDLAWALKAAAFACKDAETALDHPQGDDDRAVLS